MCGVREATGCISLCAQQVRELIADHGIRHRDDRKQSQPGGKNKEDHNTTCRPAVICNIGKSPPNRSHAAAEQVRKYQDQDRRDNFGAEYFWLDLPKLVK
jgi:hypothetical protein